jgi:hypothetical protein
VSLAANTQPRAPEFKYTLATKLGDVCVHGCRADGICGVEAGWYGTDCCACAPANFDYVAGFQGQNVHKNTCMGGTAIQAPDDQDLPLPGAHSPGFQCQESWDICRCHANRGKCKGVEWHSGPNKPTPGSNLLTCQCNWNYGKCSDGSDNLGKGNWNAWNRDELDLVKFQGCPSAGFIDAEVKANPMRTIVPMHIIVIATIAGFMFCVGGVFKVYIYLASR